MISPIPMTGPRAWVTRLLATGGPQAKKVAYLSVVMASIAWLSIDLRHGISASWVTVYGLLLSAVTTGYLGGKKIGLAGSIPPGGNSAGTCADSAGGGQ